MLERAVQGEMVNPGKNARVRRDAIRARRDLIRARIAVGQEAAAGAETAAMAAEYADHALIGEMAWDLADAWKARGRMDKAAGMLEMAVQGKMIKPDNNLRVRRDLIGARIAVGQQEQAEKDIAEFVRVYGQDALLGKMLRQVGTEYEKAGKRDRAAEMYRYVAEHWAGEEQGIGAEIAAVALRVREEDFGGVAVAVHELEDRLGKNPRRAALSVAVAEAYMKRAELSRVKDREVDAEASYVEALGECDKVLGGMPDAPEARAACFIAAKCHNGLRQHEATIEDCRMLLDKWPDHPQTGYVLYLMGRSYLDLYANDKVSQEQAMKETQAAYERLVQGYPEHPGAGTARSWLQRHGVGGEVAEQGR